MRAGPGNATITRCQAIALLLAALAVICLCFSPFVFRGELPLALGHIQPGHAAVNPAVFRNLDPVRDSLGAADNFDSSLAYHMHLWHSLRAGRIPHWDPYSASGHPFLAECVPGVLAPTRLLLFLAGPFVSNGLILIAGFLIRYLGMALLLRALGLRFSVALAGGVVYALSGYFTAWLGAHYMGETVSWTPVTILLLELAVRNRHLSWAGWGAAAVAAQFFSGHLQMALYGVLTIGLYAFGLLLRETTCRRLVAAATAIIIIGGFLLAMPQLLPSAASLQESTRTKRHGINPLPLTHLLLYAVPDLFGDQTNYHGPLGYIGAACFVGMLTVFFAASAVVRPSPRLWPALAVLGGGLLLTYCATVNYCLAWLPVIKYLQHFRCHVIVTFGLVVLAGFGLDAEKGRQWWWRLVLVAGGMAGSAWLIAGGSSAALRPLLPLLLPLLLLTAVRSVFARSPRLAPVLRATAIVLMLVELISYTNGRTTWISPAVLAQMETPFIRFAREHSPPDRVRNYGVWVLFTGSYYWYQFLFTDGYMVFVPRRDALLHERLEPEGGSFSRRYASLLSARYVFTTDILPLPLIAGDRHSAMIYENPDPLPRAGIYFSSRRGTDDDALAWLADPGFPVRDAICLPPEAPDLPAAPTGARGTAVIVREEAHEVVISSAASAPGWLLLTDSFDPFWRVEVDGHDAPLYRANMSFRAVPVPAGAATVRFWYQPRPFYAGVLIALFTALVLICYCRRRPQLSSAQEPAAPL